MRRGLLRAMLAVYGGLPARRPDQNVPSSDAGVAPGASSRVVRARQVIIAGTGNATGLFVYNGTPANGNPPQVAIVNSATTVDPYNNPIASSKILIQANIITETGGIFRTSGSAPLIQLDGPHDCIFVYDASANLVMSENPSASNVNDGLGHTVYQGLVQYAGNLAQIVQLLDGTVALGTPGQIGLTSGQTPAALQLDLGNPSIPGTLIIDSGLAGLTDASALMELFSKTAGLSGAPFVQLPIAALNPLGAVTQVTDTMIGDRASGYPGYLAGTGSGEDGSYNIGTQYNGNASSVILGTGASTVIATAKALGSGKRYRVVANMVVEMGAAAAVGLVLQLTGPTVSAANVKWLATSGGGAAPTVAAGDSQGSLASFTTAAFPASSHVSVWMSADITTSSSAVLDLTAAVTAANVTTAVPVGASLDVSPIG